MPFRVLIASIVCYFSGLMQLSAQPLVHDSGVQFIPIGGNAWIAGGGDSVTKEGIVNWSDPRSVCRVFVRVTQPGTFKVSLVLPADGTSKIKVTILNKHAEVSVDGGVAGEWSVTAPGYVPVEIQGLSKSGNNFGTLTGIGVSGSAITPEMTYVKNNDGNYFYWGRRGPSVHLRYDTGGKDDVEWFYSEITVPEKNDVIGSYYMANGFGEGYFGMQVNSETERRVLFSVWSPFKTDDPKAIPEGERIVLEKKGEGVYTGEFGNEGSGGQSYLRYNWKADQSYGFLLRAQPDGAEATTYTAWFLAPEVSQWKLIASFKRPKKSTYLKGLYSFLENFVPETGHLTRMAYYSNQWLVDSKGVWTELKSMMFTGDATARKNYRKDYAGGVEGTSFFLKNCGFFNDFTALDQTFTKTSIGKPPKIDFSKLP